MIISIISEEDKVAPFEQHFRDHFAKELKAVKGTASDIKVSRGDIAYCIGCLKCWANSSADCLSNDRFKDLEKQLEGCDLVIFLSPIHFGTFSPVIKTLIDKGLGSKLYGDRLYPQMFVGFGEDLSPEEKSCFTDIVNNHMGYADVVHPELSGNRYDAFASSSMNDNMEIIQKISSIYHPNTIEV